MALLVTLAPVGDTASAHPGQWAQGSWLLWLSGWPAFLNGRIWKINDWTRSEKNPCFPYDLATDFLWNYGWTAYPATASGPLLLICKFPLLFLNSKSLTKSNFHGKISNFLFICLQLIVPGIAESPGVTVMQKTIYPTLLRLSVPNCSSQNEQHSEFSGCFRFPGVQSVLSQANKELDLLLKTTTALSWCFHDSVYNWHLSDTHQ